MWGHSIDNINDVQREERMLIEKLLETGLVKSVRFLSFNKRYPTASIPFIQIDEIQEMDTSDILVCTLRGKGRKQNGQIIHIEVNKGLGNMLNFAFKTKISIEKFELLIELTAVGKE
jgi:hypothetical protein